LHEAVHIKLTTHGASFVRAGGSQFVHDLEKHFPHSRVEIRPLSERPTITISPATRAAVTRFFLTHNAVDYGWTIIEISWSVAQ